MSAATEFPPIVHIPERARLPRRPAVARPRGRVVVAFPAGTAAESAPVAPSCLTRVPAPATTRDPAARGVVRSDRAVMSSTVRLTRRGWAVLLGAATVLAGVLLWIAFLSGPSAAATGSTGAIATPAQVTVQPGDTLWSIAERVAPNQDPRAVVYDLQQVNHLASATVHEGDVLRTS